MENKIKIHFLGAAGTVTGSKYLIETKDRNILVDCGLFQGLKELRLLNWETIPFDVAKIDVVLLTHGHLDHVGYLPRLVSEGFSGDIWGTAPTLEIAKLILGQDNLTHTRRWLHTVFLGKELRCLGANVSPVSLIRVVLTAIAEIDHSALLQVEAPLTKALHQVGRVRHEQHRTSGRCGMSSSGPSSRPTSTPRESTARRST